MIIDNKKDLNIEVFFIVYNHGKIENYEEKSRKKR